MSATVVTVSLLTRDSNESAIPQSRPEDSLKQISDECTLAASYFDIGDGGRTITLQGKGETSPGLPWSQIECILDATRMPDSIRGRFGNTRAMDGMQTADWDKFSASWNYHPRSGVNLVIAIR
ncbi:MAG TPA: hypothetical protein VFV67_29870 [Actinophytocola sp.]|uniref:hypothetical protein n=1 Tax=Actinophytocola sp. TaxID=1872138 RepID=UPI002DBDAC26|nr:hypothetical protein [Actinophytocola sp.]HEU5474873.1 hypothetical protein [Actinophytocola sp.]